MYRQTDRKPHIHLSTSTQTYTPHTHTLSDTGSLVAVAEVGEEETE